MERLTQNNFDYCLEMCEPECMHECPFYKDDQESKCHTAAMYDRLAAYEDLEEQGRLIVLPCKVGTSCKHAIGEIYINSIGEACLQCEIWGCQRNITLGDCIGNCDCEEEAAMKGVSEDTRKN